MTDNNLKCLYCDDTLESGAQICGMCPSYVPLVTKRRKIQILGKHCIGCAGPVSFTEEFCKDCIDDPNWDTNEK